MAKKTRRARLSPTQRYMPTPGAPPAQTGVPAARPAPRASQPVVQSEEKPEDPAYIRADLQRMGILAGSILAILIALRIFVFR